MKITLLIVLSLILTFDQNWELKKDKEGIKVYMKEDSESDFKEFKAVCVSGFSMLKFLGPIRDVERYPEWQEIKEVKILEMVNENDAIIWLHYDMPWPVWDRDMIVQTKCEIDTVGGYVNYSFYGIPDHIAEKEGIVRVPAVSGTWTLKRTENGQTEVIHSMSINPGGSLPSWVVNIFAVDAPYLALKNIQERVKTVN